PERLERMPRDVEAEDLLLLRQPLGVGERREVRQHARRVDRARAGLAEAEQRELPDRRLLLLERRLLERAVEHRRQLRPMPAQAVERARADQRLEHALVA